MSNRFKTNTTSQRKWFSYVETLPWRQGQLDDSSYDASLRAASLYIDQEFVFEVLSGLIEDAGDQPNGEKIWSQINRAHAWVHGHLLPGSNAPARVLTSPRGARATRKVKATFQAEQLHKLAANLAVGPIVSFVEERSHFQPAYITSAGFLTHIYKPGEKVVIFSKYKSQGQFVWEYDLHQNQELPVAGPDGIWFLANSVDGLFHPNPRQGGRMSRRSAESITAFRFAVLESDKAVEKDWLAFLAQAPLRIVAIYHSGGRSIHALVQVDAKSKADWDDQIKPVKPMLTTIGADPGALSAVRLTRLPQEYRGDRLQRLIYLNPAADGTPICDQPPRPLHHDSLHWAQIMLNAGLVITKEEAVECLQTLKPFANDAGVAGVVSKIEAIAGSVQL